MALKTTNFTLILSIILLYAVTVMSFDITKLLEKHGEFSEFNKLLTYTGLATNINNRQTITVFVVEDSEMGSITSKPIEVAKNILATHVVLDYYDMDKLANFDDKSHTLTTLFQAMGAATSSQGFLEVSVDTNIRVGSAVNNAPQNAKVLKSVESEPYNISVLQISEPIITPGIDQVAPSVAPKAESPTLAPSPNKSHEKSKGKAPQGSEDTESKSKDDSSSSSSSETNSAPNASSESTEEAADNKSPPHHNAASARKDGVVLPTALLGFLALAF